MMQPEISIILPTYNGSIYLAEAIESCLKQTYQDWELIIVDDCSTDATPDIIARYVARDSRINSIRHQTNRKLPEALNSGHALARGRYLMWTSDDNRLLSGALEEMHEFLQQHPDVGLVYTDCTIIDEHGRYIANCPARPPSELAYENALSPCFMYRRSVYEDVGKYDTEQFLAEDYEYWLRVYRRYPMGTLHKTLYEYRHHSGSLTNTQKSMAVWISAERALRKHLPYLTQSSREERARGWLFCAVTAARRRALLPAASAAGRALAMAPAFALGYVSRKIAERLWRRTNVGPSEQSQALR
jgi:glycosyltransferase involved in cell wall biosynthesis